ncbi:MAG: pyruvate kinase [Chitinophagales bacterium]|nr:pyruvate kinase [Chitinophagales bacterium]MCZ2393993.1 pyruvate kinase [Chitinophagales bacterium]
MRRKTKIIATIGPATNSFEQLEKLYLAGVNAFRLNFSHGSHEDHLKVINFTEELNKKYNAHISLLADLQGPKLRVGVIENGSVILNEGQLIQVVTKPVLGNANIIDVTYETLPQDVKVGEQILIDDGKITLEVEHIKNNEIVVCKVIEGGELSSKKGFNLPNTVTSVPSLTPKDLKDLDFILEHPINWVALSFVRDAKEVYELKEIIRTKNGQARVMAKIEKPEAVINIDEIILAADAIMVARGDLGVEMPMEEMAIVQKRIVRKCLQQARPVVIATQVMESMLEMSRPTRAEITDVSNAVLDGADVIMLSGETSVGKYPIKVIETIDKIISRVEKESGIYNKGHIAKEGSPTFFSDAICYNACRIAHDVQAKCINAMTYSGYTGFVLASYRPESDIYIFTSNKFLLNTLSIVWGTNCFYYNSFESTDDTIEDVISLLKEEGIVESGDVVINTGSMPIRGRGRTNMIKLSEVK